MHDTFFFIRQISGLLAQKLPGFSLAQCFSQSKDEIVLGFCTPAQDFWLRATFLPHFCLLNFPLEFQRARRNSVDLFEPLDGLLVESVRQYHNERAFTLEFEGGYGLLFKLFGNRANLILCQNGSPVQVFHKKFSQDLALDPRQLDRSLPRDMPLAESPLLGRQLRSYLAAYPADAAAAEVWQPRAYYITAAPEQLWLFRPQGRDVVASFADAISAANGFYEAFLRSYGFAQAKTDALQNLAAKIAKARSYIAEGYQRLEALGGANPYEKSADLLMAYLHEVPAGADIVELPDFETAQPIAIRLNDKLSPQKNAEAYYRRAKNRRIETETLEKSIAAKENALSLWQSHHQAIAAIPDYASLKKYLKTHGLGEAETTETAAETFKTLTVEGFVVLVGKNARQNELLLRKAAKDDLWLHVRDAKGSHVLIKQIPGRAYPKAVLERAAELAAFYSERRHDSLCAVIYTPRKFVRKRKGAEAGEVIVDKEQVLLVWPKGMEGAEFGRLGEKA